MVPKGEEVAKLRSDPALCSMLGHTPVDQRESEETRRARAGRRKSV